MTVGCIAERLTMGTRGYLNHLLYRRRKLRASKQYQELTPFIGSISAFWIPPVRVLDQSLELTRAGGWTRPISSAFKPSKA